MPFGMTDETFRSLPLEARVRLLLSELTGWEHPQVAGGRSRVPRDPTLIGHVIPEGAIDSRAFRIDCSTMTAFLVLGAFLDAAWDEDSYGDLVIFNDRIPDRPYSPIEAIERAGVGSRVRSVVGVADSMRLAGRESPVILLGQFWRSKWEGHAMLVAVHSDATLHLVESTTRGDGGPIIHGPHALDYIERRFPEGYALAALGEG